MKADILREKFLDFFKSKKHKIVESDSLVPKDDPTVLFTPAGMNQFKKQFLGMITDFTRAASSQRCLRTGDLDNVGKTIGHHTFFEMLGNFSFGDYFKEDAIIWAWEFLTKELKIKEERLWVSVYKDDDEAYDIWKDKIKVPAKRIVKLGDKENFWPSEAKQKGPNGPCGPCSEIYFDQGKDKGCGKEDCDPGCDCGRFLEIWNLVFTQFNRKEDGTLEPLPQKNIDTGMGLERLAAVMQGVPNNFETDLFAPIIKEISCGLKAEALSSREFIYAVADHIRAVTFTIYDGVLPSNEGRGYIVRKLIRKSVLHLRSLGINKPFLHKLVPVLSEAMKAPYPDLDKRRENISEIILAEEKNFISTLNSSDTLLEEKFTAFKDKQDEEKAGVVAFQLYDTYGIPFELTKSWLDKQGIKVSPEAFDKELERQKSRSKSLSSMQGDVFSVKELDLKVKNTEFLGYEGYSSGARVLKIVKDSKEANEAGAGEEVKIILDKTPFYAESGGQIGDTGELVAGKNIFEVKDTKKSGKVIIHIGRVKEGVFKNSDTVEAKVDIERRLAVARNHTATHLLQAALRKVLGEHVQQQGSLVAQDRLRFDFTHFKNIDRQELDRIEEVVNGYILNNIVLNTKELSLTEAKKHGALAFFGEKYEEKVRMVSVGGISKELCGGTHLEQTGQIGLFKIIQESSIASGVRRIEAATGTAAYKIIKKQEDILGEVSSLLSSPEERVCQELAKRIGYIKELEKKLSALEFDSVKSSVDALVQDSETINDVRLITKVLDNLDMDLLRKTVDLIKEKTGNCVIALGSSRDQKAFLVVGTGKDGPDASKLIKEIAPEIGGSGGGRKDFAQAGGTKPENLQKALDKFKEIAKRQLQ
ncbi:MAG: alanine--tRNA ligase [Candidatus Omnitrophica bacterium]|nr:alanine--tRNA ligase [Candidatus Omnitrophota bacterium]